MAISMNERRALIIGAGAIGAALAARLLNLQSTQGAFGYVDLTWHSNAPTLNHSKLRLLQLNPTSDDELHGFAQARKVEGIKYDWVLNCTGFLSGNFGSPEKRIADIDPEFFIENMRVNSLPTLLIAKHFSHLINDDLNSEAPAIFAVISAKVGSISDNRLGGWYSYRTSKAALNMAIKTLSIEWQRRYKKRCVVALHPGTTQSPLSKPFSAHVPPGKYFTAEQTADYLIEQLLKLKPENTGEFIAWSGERLSW